jgi:alpha-tubulin suppressor-like RCC1 family protein
MIGFNQKISDNGSVKSQTGEISSHQDNILRLVCGDAHNFVLTESGKLYSFGYNNQG